MPTEGLGGGYDPEALAVGGDQELTGAGIGELVPLELAADGGGVLGPEVVGVGAISVGALDDDAFGLDHELGEFLFGGLGVVAGVDPDLDLCVEARVDFGCGVDAGFGGGGFDGCGFFGGGFLGFAGGCGCGLCVRVCVRVGGRGEGRVMAMTMGMGDGGGRGGGGLLGGALADHRCVSVGIGVVGLFGVENKCLAALHVVRAGGVRAVQGQRVLRVVVVVVVVVAVAVAVAVEDANVHVVAAAAAVRGVAVGVADADGRRFGSRRRFIAASAVAHTACRARVVVSAICTATAARAGGQLGLLLGLGLVLLLGLRLVAAGGRGRLSRCIRFFRRGRGHSAGLFLSRICHAIPIRIVCSTVCSFLNLTTA